MSNTKMLIDATHPEETRVVVQRNGRVEEFDFESATRKLLRGNIYLAKVTRVEPSLQAAFVDYGGNRHGFLAFNEIHPDYYQIPVADRQALLDEEAAAEAELEAAADRRAEALARRSGSRDEASAPADSDGEGDEDYSAEAAPIVAPEEASHIVDVEEDEHIEEVGGEASDDATIKVVAASVRETSDTLISEPVEPRQAAEDADPTNAPTIASAAEPAAEGSHYEDDAGTSHEAQPAHPDDEPHSEDDDEDKSVARDGGYSDRSSRGRSSRGFQDDGAPRQRRRPRSYKIQEVIKRRQIILVQVVKEERGNKGAALTTYLSLAGRYTVLMPNTARGGGISRKITNPQDRRRLKSIAQELEVPEGMGLIIRTAGAARTKQEIKRDFEYLLRLWESVRELTLQSTAPSLVYEEGDLIKRSIRDLYNKDVEEIVVAGDAGHLEAADFMKMLMPSHARNVVAYKEPTPLFTRYGVERQLNAMFQPQVTLRSGGYIVINQTEALVAIDVNSGKSTREFSIEETALATNLEAADEIARQLKLRDLAGLIVIDFIDMEEKRNNRSVERRLKDALRFDRARIQLGRISHFGLMEMSRQRLRTGVLEGSTSQCPHCQGTGIIRSTESVALAVLRGLEDTITAGANGPLVATTTPVVALYILNSKRAYIADMETRHGHTVTVLGSDRVHGANFTVERGAPSVLPARRSERTAVNMDWGFDGEEEAPAAEIQEIEIAPDATEGDDAGRANEPRERSFDRGDGDDNGARRGRRRRRRGRGGRDHGDRDHGDRERPNYEARGNQGSDASEDEADHAAPGGSNDFAADAAGDEPGSDQPDVQDANGEDRPGRRRRRGRRGGRRGRERRPGEMATESGDAANDDTDQPDLNDEPAGDLKVPSSDAVNNGGSAEIAPGKPSRGRRTWDTPVAANGDEKPTSPPEIAATPVAAPEPVRRRHETGSSEPRIERVVVKPGDHEGGNGEAAPAPQRKGWWQRNFGGS